MFSLHDRVHDITLETPMGYCVLINGHKREQQYITGNQIQLLEMPSVQFSSVQLWETHAGSVWQTQGK